MTNDHLSIWTIYDHPTDYPNSFVARRHEVTKNGSMPTTDLLIAETIDQLRALLPLGMTRLSRSPDDDPHILEVWL